MDKTEAEDLVRVMERNEVKKLVKEKQKVALEEQFSRKKLTLNELNRIIKSVILRFNISKKRILSINYFRIMMAKTILQQVFQQKLSREIRRTRT